MTFSEIYREELQRAVTEHPDEYAWTTAPTVIHGNAGITVLPARTVDSVADTMIAAIQARSFNKDGRACKATCKRLGIKHTYTAIYAYLASEGGAS